MTTVERLTEAEWALLSAFDSAEPIPYDFDAVQCLTCHGLLELEREENGVYYWRLSRSARLLVDARRKDAAERAEHKAKDELAEATRLKERHEDYANDERRYRTQNKIAIIMPIVTFLLGLIVEHFFGILALIFGTFS